MKWYSIVSGIGFIICMLWGCGADSMEISKLLIGLGIGIVLMLIGVIGGKINGKW